MDLSELALRVLYNWSQDHIPLLKKKYSDLQTTFDKVWKQLLHWQCAKSSFQRNINKFLATLTNFFLLKSLNLNFIELFRIC